MVENRVSSSADSTFQQAPRKANKQKDVHWDDLNHTKFFTYGIGFFLGIRATLFPFSLIKTRLQVQEGPPTTTLRAISQILRTQGPRGLYRGFGVTALGSIPSQSAYLLSYEFVKSKTANICSENLGFDDQKSVIIGGLLGGGAASLSSQMIVVPVDVVSQRLMIQSHTNPQYYGATDAFRKIISKEGIAGIYRGFLISNLTYIPNSAIWWASYGFFRKLVDSALLKDDSALESRHDIPQSQNKQQQQHQQHHHNTFGGSLNTSTPPVNVSTLSTSPSESTKSLRDFLPLHFSDIIIQAACGAAAGCVSVFCTNPMDVVKTRLQTETRTMAQQQMDATTSSSSFLSSQKQPGSWSRTFRSELRDIAMALKMLVKEDGYFRGLTRGMAARMMSVAPTSIMMILSYETVKKLSVKEGRI